MTRRLVESVEGLNSSLVLASGDLWPKNCEPIYWLARSLKGLHMSIKSLEIILQLLNLVHRQNSSILATLHCCPCSKAKQTCALTVFLPPNIPDQQCLPASNSAAERRIIFSASMTQSTSPWRRTNTTFCAYDMVNKEVVLSKLLSYGISGGMFHFIR